MMTEKTVSHFKTSLLSVLLLFTINAVAQTAIKPMVLAPQTEPPAAPAVDPTAVPAVQPGAQPQNPVAAEREEEKRQKKEESSQKAQEMMQQMAQSLGGGAGSPGAGFNSGTGSTGQPGYGSAFVGSGKLETCELESLPSHIRGALSQAKNFKNTCRAADRGPNQPIAINDYTCIGRVARPTMYIFVGDKCYRTAVSYGNGGGRGCPLPCNDDGDHMTPAGFHLTGTHSGGASGKYDDRNSLLMVGLENQGSGGRGILIHAARSPGTASSWGCSGVKCYSDVRAKLGKGALVYNFFGATPAPSGCSKREGLARPPSACQLEPGHQQKVPSGSIGPGAESAQ
jgi:hypothetical protein